MRKVLLVNGPLASQDFPFRSGVKLVGTAISSPMLPPGQSALGLWRHELMDEARLELDRPDEDHVFYVAAGEIHAAQTKVGVGGVLCVAKDAMATIVPNGAGVILLHYVGNAATRPEKAGGCVHVLSSEGLISKEKMVQGVNTKRVLYAGSGCPTCGIWLHKASMPHGVFVPPHCHSEDEIINVVDGDLVVGARSLGKDAAVAVAKGAYYSFSSGDKGLTFLNFRQNDPHILIKGADPPAWRSERESWSAEHGAEA